MFDVCRENNHPGGNGVEENVRTKGGAKDKIREGALWRCSKTGGFLSPPPPPQLLGGSILGLGDGRLH